MGSTAACDHTDCSVCGHTIPPDCSYCIGYDGADPIPPPPAKRYGAGGRCPRKVKEVQPSMPLPLPWPPSLSLPLPRPPPPVPPLPSARYVASHALFATLQRTMSHPTHYLRHFSAPCRVPHTICDTSAHRVASHTLFATLRLGSIAFVSRILVVIGVFRSKQRNIEKQTVRR